MYSETGHAPHITNTNDKLFGLIGPKGPTSAYGVVCCAGSYLNLIKQIPAWWYYIWLSIVFYKREGLTPAMDQVKYWVTASQLLRGINMI